MLPMLNGLVRWTAVGRLSVSASNCLVVVAAESVQVAFNSSVSEVASCESYVTESFVDVQHCTGLDSSESVNREDVD